MSSIAEIYYAQFTKMNEEYRILCDTTYTKNMYMDIMKMIDDKMRENLKENKSGAIYVKLCDEFINRHNKDSEYKRCVKILPLMIYIVRKMKSHGFIGSHGILNNNKFYFIFNRNDKFFRNESTNSFFSDNKQTIDFYLNENSGTKRELQDFSEIPIEIEYENETVITSDNGIYNVDSVPKEIVKPHINMSIEKIIKSIM